MIPLAVLRNNLRLARLNNLQCAVVSVDLVYVCEGVEYHRPVVDSANKRAIGISGLSPQLLNPLHLLFTHQLQPQGICHGKTHVKSVCSQIRSGDGRREAVWGLACSLGGWTGTCAARCVLCGDVSSTQH